MSTSLPKVIEICPIVDALVEIRFIPKVHPNAVFGIIYNEIKAEFKSVENLPIVQLPEQLRSSDPSMKFKPYYKVKNEDFIIQIGPDVLTISSFPEYAGWKKFSHKIFSMIEIIEKLKIVDRVERLGIRYINFFEGNIFDKIKLNLSITGEDVLEEKTLIRTQIKRGKFYCTLQLSNDARTSNRPGSIIDIDCYKNKGLQDFFKNKKSLVNEGHLKEKELFFSLLKDEFLNELKPKY